MIECKKLCSLQGKFTDQQIFRIMTIMTAGDVVPQWKREICILGGCTADGVIALINGCVEWTSVTIHNCNMINMAFRTRVQTHALFNTCFRGLKELDLSNCREDGMWWEAFRFFKCYAMFPDIQKLCLRDMDIRDDIFMVLQRFKNLKELDLSGNRLLTNYGLRSYYTFQRDAERVDNQYETDIKEEDARLGAAVRVKVVSCPHITDWYVQELRKEFPTAIIQTH